MSTLTCLAALLFTFGIGCTPEPPPTQEKVDAAKRPPATTTTTSLPATNVTP